MKLSAPSNLAVRNAVAGALHVRQMGQTAVLKTSTVSKRVGMIWDPVLQMYVPNPDLEVVQRMQIAEFKWNTQLTPAEKAILKAKWDATPPRSATGREYVANTPTTWNQTQVTRARQYAWSTTYQDRYAESWPTSPNPVPPNATYEIRADQRVNDYEFRFQYHMTADPYGLFTEAHFITYYPPGTHVPDVHCGGPVAFWYVFPTSGWSNIAVYTHPNPIVKTGASFYVSSWVLDDSGGLALNSQLTWTCP